MIDPQGSRDLVDRAKTDDATLSLYPGMLHAPLCEGPGVRAKVEAEVAGWVEARLGSSGAPGSS